MAFNKEKKMNFPVKRCEKPWKTYGFPFGFIIVTSG